MLLTAWSGVLACGSIADSYGHNVSAFMAIDPMLYNSLSVASVIIGQPVLKASNILEVANMRNVPGRSNIKP